MVTATINGKAYDIPTDVTELSLKQFFGLRNPENKNVLDEISALTGIDRNTFENVKDLKSLKAFTDVTAILAKSIKKGFDTSKKPSDVIIGMKRIKVPTELRLQPIGAYMQAHDVLSERTNEMLKQSPGMTVSEIDYTDCIPKVLAAYFFWPYHGENALYSDIKTEAPEWIDKIMNMRLIDAVPIANDFFLKYPNLT